MEELLKQFPVPKDQENIVKPQNVSQDELTVKRFYERDNISTCLPGKKDFLVKKDEVGKKVLVRKRVLNDSKDNIFKIFKEEHPDIKMGRTKFFSLNPDHVLSFKKMPTYSCQCKIHENYRLSFNALKKYITDDSMKVQGTFMNTLVCDYSNYNCMTHQCNQCNNILHKIKNMINFQNNDYLCYHQWDLVNKKNQLKDIKSKPNPFLKKFCEQFIEFKKHCYIANTQSRYLFKEINEFDAATVKVIFDFSENFTLKPLNEIQAAFYTRSQISLYTAVAYIPIQHEDGQEIRTACFGIISNCLNHDKYAVYTFNDNIFKCITSNHNGIKKFHLFSDGAPSQFKNSFSL